MLYLTTGANGAGKTLLTLRDVREKSVKENRPVVHNGRFDLTADFNWKKIDFKDWQAEPDGTIFIIDECHNDMPATRGAREALPDHIRMLAEHRKRGFDFFLITQHPMNVDSFVRRLIGSPGWHRHLKRTSGAPLVSVLTWPSVNIVCEKAGSGESGSVAMVPFPREVYNWYTSTSLDTAKIKIPFQAKLFVAMLLLVPVLGWYGWKAFKAAQPGAKPIAVAAAPGLPGAPGQIPGGPAPGAPSPEKKPMTTGELVASYTPRLIGLAQTAPRYDDLMKPTTVPYPAACISMGDRCGCYSQQATRLDVPQVLCREIVKGGFFQDWGQALQQAKASPSAVPSSVGAQSQNRLELEFPPVKAKPISQVI